MSAKQHLYDAISAFAELHAYPLQLSDIECREALTALLEEAYTTPDPLWIRVLSDLNVSDDQNNRDKTSMIKARRSKHLIIDLLYGKDATNLGPNHIGIWPNASLVASSAPIRKGYEFLEKFNSIRQAF